METKKTNSINRRGERVFLLLFSVVLSLLFYQLYRTLNRDFDPVPAGLANGSIVNLNAGNEGPQVRRLLQQGFYFEDARDINLIKSVIDARLHDDAAKIENIGELNKRKYYVPASEAYTKGGESFQKRVQLSRRLLGFTGTDSLLFIQEQKAPQV